MGAIECELPNKQVFHIGTGFADSQRTAQGKPKIGSIVTFKYQELSNNGHPRFPVFLRVREDITWKDVLKNYKENPPFSATKKVIPVLKKDHSLLFSTIPSRDETGNKVITDQDACGSDDGEEEENLSKSASTPNSTYLLITKLTVLIEKQKPICKYGDKCYQTNKEHLERFDHPPKVVSFGI